MNKTLFPSAYLSHLQKEQQILELNNEVKCTIGVSKIHGVGVIALRDIYQGDKCYIRPRIVPTFYTVPYSSFKKLFPEIRDLILARWPSVVNGSLFKSPNDDVGLLSFCNHSNDPNYNVITDTALRDIKKGEEITEDYRKMAQWNLAYPNLHTWKSNEENQES